MVPRERNTPALPPRPTEEVWKHFKPGRLQVITHLLWPSTYVVLPLPRKWRRHHRTTRQNSVEQRGTRYCAVLPLDLGFKYPLKDKLNTEGSCSAYEGASKNISFPYSDQSLHLLSTGGVYFVSFLMLSGLDVVFFSDIRSLKKGKLVFVQHFSVFLFEYN